MYADGQTEVQAYTSADRSLAVGGVARGSSWTRPADVAGVGLAGAADGAAEGDHRHVRASTEEQLGPPPRQPDTQRDDAAEGRDEAEDDPRGSECSVHSAIIQGAFDETRPGFCSL